MLSVVCSTPDFSNFKKMTLKNFLLFFIVFPVTLFAQRNNPHQAVTTSKLYPAEAIETFDLRKTTKIERVFFNEDWLEGKFIFSADYNARQTFPLKYDILNQELNVDVAGAIYVVPLDSIHGFVLENSLSVNNYEFTIRRRAGEKSAEIFEIAINGENQLLIKHQAEKLNANYQPALDTGSRDEKVIKKQRFYLLDQDGHLLEIPKKKKAAESLFSQYPNAKKYLAKKQSQF